MVRTRAFQACNGGSTPPGVTRKIVSAMRRFFFLEILLNVFFIARQVRRCRSGYRRYQTFSVSLLRGYRIAIVLCSMGQRHDNSNFCLCDFFGTTGTWKHETVEFRLAKIQTQLYCLIDCVWFTALHGVIKLGPHSLCNLLVGQTVTVSKTVSTKNFSSIRPN